MVGYLARRVINSVVTIFLIVTVSFFLMRVAPGGPFDRERPLDPTVRANLEARYNLDKPLYKQYFYYLAGLARGDMGPSFVYRDFTVAELIGNGLPVSMQLGGAALALALVVGTTLGVFAALGRNGPVDYTTTSLAVFGVTVPAFVVAPILIMIFSLGLGWTPAGGWGNGALPYKVLPVITLALPQIAIIARMTRGAMIEALRAPHVQTARANGLPRRTVIIRHALRGAMVPVVTYLAPAAAAMLTGSVVIETIFGVPGVGRYFTQGALSRDYTLVLGTVILIAVFIVVFNLIVDLMYSVIDPRVRLR